MGVVFHSDLRWEKKSITLNLAMIKSALLTRSDQLTQLVMHKSFSQLFFLSILIKITRHLPSSARDLPTASNLPKILQQGY